MKILNTLSYSRFRTVSQSTQHPLTSAIVYSLLARLSHTASAALIESALFAFTMYKMFGLEHVRALCYDFSREMQTRSDCELYGFILLQPHFRFKSTGTRYSWVNFVTSTTACLISDECCFFHVFTCCTSSKQRVSQVQNIFLVLRDREHCCLVRSANIKMDQAYRNLLIILEL